jgi:hypothetical protein
MRKISTLVIVLSILLIGSTGLKAQYVTIPDANFRTWLTTNYPACMSGNQMDTTCAAIINEDSVEVANLSIADITGISYFDNLEYLKCSNNDLTFLPPLKNGLLTLIAEDNYLTTIQFPNSLVYLNAADNNIAIQPQWTPNLYKIYFDGNLLDSLTNLNPGVNLIYFTSNDLEYIDAFPSSVQYIIMGYNNLTSLPNLPNNLIELTLFSNPITTLPSLPSTLRKLVTSSCHQLTSIPTIPASLITLEMQDNPLITAVPALPLNIKGLFIGDNPQITTLSASLDFLITLDARNTNISVFPPMPLINSLTLNHTPIVQLPLINDSLISLRFDSTLVTCMPGYIKKVLLVLYFPSGITCLPREIEMGAGSESVPPRGAFPLCLPGNVNGCDVVFTHEGFIYRDLNSNCIDDITDPYILNTKVMAYNSGNLIEQFYATGGRYSFDFNNGTYDIQVDTSALPLYVTCPASGIQTSTINAVNPIDTGLDFGMECKPGFDVGVSSLTHLANQIFFPADTVDMYMYAGDMATFFGTNCNTQGLSGTVQVDILGNTAQYAGVWPNSMPPATTTPSSVIWNVSDFSTINPSTDFNFRVVVDSFATATDNVCFQVVVTPTAGDNYLPNNSFKMCYEVRTSYDPNDKAAYPAGDIDTAQEWLTYTIRFQNTGNAPAQYIHVDDTLDTDIDESSFRLLYTSHNPLNTTLTGRAVRFSFPNINLPDSVSNEPASHGMVQYSVKLKEGLPVNTVINNTANIYFDFNPPVVTNTTVNTITIPDGLPAPLSNLAFAIMPNPAHNTVTVQLQNITANTTLKVFDILGAVVKQQTIQQATTFMDISALLSGIYFVQVETANGRGVKKLVVQ